MKLRAFWFYAFILTLHAALQQGCRPIEVRIVGTFEIDPEVGCDDCPGGGPLIMSFDGEESPDIPPRYRFDHPEGEGHAGTYLFEAVDSTGTSLILYPDSSGPFHADLLGEVIISDYNVGGNRITEACGSGVRRCVWRKK